MPKQIDWEEIRKYWQQTGASPQALVDRFGVSKRSVDERLPKWRETEKPPNVVSIQSAKTAKPKARSSRRADDIDELQIVDLAISDLSAVLAGGEADSRSLGSIAGALVRLLEFRRKIVPKTAAELAELVIAMGVSPAEFVTELKAKWQQSA